MGCIINYSSHNLILRQSGLIHYLFGVILLRRFIQSSSSESSCNTFGGQSSAAVLRPHGNVQNVGSNPAAARNENQTLGTPLQKVAQWSGQDLSGRPAVVSELWAMSNTCPWNRLNIIILSYPTYYIPHSCHGKRRLTISIQFSLLVVANQ